jgi:hypothetical protein
VGKLKKMSKDAEKIYGEMVKAGAEVSYKNVMANLPPVLKKSNFMKTITISKVYKTQSDGAINCKVMIIDGYFINHLGKKTPAPLIANLFEYGRHNGHYKKQPFFRKSFKKKQIQDAFYRVFVRYNSGV